MRSGEACRPSKASVRSMFSKMASFAFWTSSVDATLLVWPPCFSIYKQDSQMLVRALGFPEANVLVPVDQVAVRSLTPASKSVVITVEPAK